MLTAFKDFLKEISFRKGERRKEEEGREKEKGERRKESKAKEPILDLGLGIWDLEFGTWDLGPGTGTDYKESLFAFS